MTKKIYKPSRINHIYHKMVERCINPNVKEYIRYGGRGITICDEWNNKEIAYRNTTKGWLSFKKWALENGYRDDLTIDRIDVNKGYYPENCRWITNKEQQNNTRANHFIVYKGRKQTLQQWADELGVYPELIRFRLKGGMSVEKALDVRTWNVAHGIEV